jgi:ankyrin repeat protein
LLDRLVTGGATLARAEASLGDGQTLLMLAARTGSVDALKLLLKQGANVNARERRNGTTALIWAAMENRGQAVRLLVEAGADANVRSDLTHYPHTPPAVVGDKLEEGVSYVGQTVLPKGGWTPLMYAAREGALGAAQALADAGADLDATDPEGTSALIFAIINGHFDVATALVEKGANVNLADRTGMTPLYAAVDMHTVASTFGRPDPPLAVFAGSVKAVEMLLAHGADPNVRLRTRILKRVYNAGDGKLDEGATPLMRAARAGDALLMRMLVEHGADPSLTQKNGNTLIILAAGINARGINADRASEQGSIEAIELALKHGIDINAASTNGETAVHAALGSPAILRYLVDHGARLDVKNRQGRTPLEAVLANKDADPKSIDILRQATEAGPR